MSSRRLSLLLVAAAAIAVVPTACSGSDTTPSKTSSSRGGSTSQAMGGGGSGASTTSDGGGGSSGCTLGQACEPDGICTEGDVCCPVDNACDTSCCADSDVCSFGTCVVPGDVCIDASDCLPDEYCDHSLGDNGMGGAGGGGGAGGAGANCQSGVEFQTGKCLPRPPECGPNEQPGDPPTCIEQCDYIPPSSAFDPVLKYSWGGVVTPPYSTDVMMTPVVAQLDDDNCDGKINERDIPEIVFSTFANGRYYSGGDLHVISVVDGQVVEKFPALTNAVQASGGIAIGDLDGDAVPEIVACLPPTPGGTNCCDAQAQNTGVVAFRADGTVLWTQPDTSKVHCGYESPAIANPEGNTPKVLVGLTMLEGATGAVLRELDPATSYGVRLSGFADVDGDTIQDVVEGQRAYRVDGTTLWDLRSGPDTITRGYHAIGDLDNDGTPEIVVISSSGPHLAYVLRYNPNSASGVDLIRDGIDINDGISTATFCNAASEYGGGPPTIADFNGDGFPDVGAAGAVGYVVLDGRLLMDNTVLNADTVMWFQTTQDCSSAVTGSAVFDFNGDGAAEVVYSDEINLWMYDGSTGVNLIPDTCNTSGTLWEYPVIADVDNDGQADIVMAANAYARTCNNTKQAGISIFSSASDAWVRTRRVWNQHTYHVTNVNEDGTIPVSEPTNWTEPGLNNFRQNKQPGGEFSAPDLVVSVFPNCAGEYGLVARVRNIGEASVPPDVVVGFYEGAPGTGTLLGTALTTQTLFSLGSEDVFLAVPQPNGLVSAVVDDGGPPHTWVECRTDNNSSQQVDASCGPN